jgi:tetratricopeptide (TPR) repeat protein
VESHASAASSGSRVAPASGEPAGAAAARLLSGIDLPISIVLGGVLAAIAFIANGGLQLGSSTLVEVAVLVIAALLVGAAVIAVGFEARLHGGFALATVAALGAVTALSITWSLFPSESWVETNRTLAYVAAFACGIATVRLAHARWPAVLAGVLLALTAVGIWGLATKVAPAWLAPDETYARLREPYGYWNAVGVTAAMAVPLCLWLGTREHGRRLVNALAWPLIGLFVVTMLLSFSRGSIVAAVAGIAVWLAVVPLRLRSLAVLVPSVLAAAAVTAWAFAQSALTDDNVALADRKDSGIEFGLMLVGLVVLLFVAGVVIQRRAEQRPLSDGARRKVGGAAIAAVAAAPLILLGALAFTDRGIGGTISDRWNDLTKADAATPQNEPGRLTETASVRSIYWGRAIDIWQDHPAAGAGAGSFAQAQLRYRDKPARAKHAHGYVLQTLADLGLVGVAISSIALAAWFVTAWRTLSLRRRWVAERAPPWTAERIGLAALLALVIVFGVHSTLDWTWFVPAVAMTGLFCAGWLAGRGPLVGAARSAPSVPLETTRPMLPREGQLSGRVAAACLVLAVAVFGALAMAQPWRAQQKGEDALRLAQAGDFGGARAAAEKAKDINPLSAEPYFELAAVDDAAGNERAALQDLERAVQVEPANPEAWRRLGDYYLAPLSKPDEALATLRGALFLDPMSTEARESFVSALRAQQVLRADIALIQRREARAKRRASRAVPGQAGSHG